MSLSIINNKPKQIIIDVVFYLIRAKTFNRLRQEDFDAEIAVQFVILVVVVVLLGCSDTHATDLTLNNTPTQVYFSPNGGCTDAIVKEISKAKSEILVQAYSFTSKDIAKALVDAHKRGSMSKPFSIKVIDRKNIPLLILPSIWGFLLLLMLNMQ